MRRVLYVGMLQDPRAGASFEERNIHHALRHMPGVRTSHFDFMTEHRRLGREGMSAALLAQVRATRPDLVFLVLDDQQHDPIPDIFTEIRASGAQTLLWAMDDPRQFTTHSAHWAGVVDWVVTTDANTVSKYEAIGFGDGVILSQWGVNHRLYRPHFGRVDLDASFVGMPTGDRPCTIERLISEGIALSVFGFGWRAEIPRLPFNEMVRTFSRSRINLGLSGGNTQAIKRRVFEVTGCRGFLLTWNAPGLENFFEPGREVAVYTDEDDLLRQVRYYSNHTSERRAIAVRGYRRCVREHTWDHRLKAVFDHVDQRTAVLKPAQEVAV